MENLPHKQISPQGSQPSGEKRKLLMKTTIKEITPQWASRILETRNPVNRNVAEAVVDAYASDMAAGHWLLTHQGLAFNDSGDLIDGQHRLHAVIKSGKTVKMMVTMGIPSIQNNGISLNTMDAVDRHRQRSIGQQLSMAYGWTNGTRVAAVARNMAVFCTNSNIKMTVPQTVEILNKSGDAVRRIMKTMRTNCTRWNSKVASACSLYASKFPGKAEGFMQTYISSIGWAEGCAQKALDSWCANNPSAVSSGGHEAIHATASALFYFHRNESVKIVRVNQRASDWLLGLNPELVAFIRKVVII